MVGKKEKKAENAVLTTGKRKRAVARARFEPGKGIIKVNMIPLNLIKNEMIRMKMEEPLMLLGDEWKNFNVNVNVSGGGITGQADAARQAIAKGFVKLLGSEKKKKMMEYDKFMLISDSRRTEPHKPPRSSQGPRRYKQRSKR